MEVLFRDAIETAQVGTVTLPSLMRGVCSENAPIWSGLQTGLA